METMKYNPWNNWPETGKAIVSPTGTLSYKQLKVITLGLEDAFRAEGVTEKSTVEIQLPDALAWIATLALFRIGAVSYVANSSAAPLLPDFIISTKMMDLNQVAPIIGFRPEWLNGDWLQKNKLEAISAEPDMPMPSKEKLLRVILTSGTSGTPKAVAIDLAQLVKRLEFLRTYWADSSHELNLMGLSSTGGFYSALSAFINGHPYYTALPFTEKSLEIMLQEPISLLSGSPVQIRDFVSALLKKNVSMPTVKKVRMAGATAPEALLNQIGSIVPQAVIEVVYGSTEAGGVTRRIHQPGDDPQNVGRPIDGVVLEIIREDGAPSDLLELGRVRYRTPGLIADYKFQPEEAKKYFIDGWFYPGDQGCIDDSGSLILAGRDSDDVNLGGEKVNLSNIDKVARAFPGITDAATFVTNDDLGLPVLAIAVVGSPAEMRGLDRSLRKKFLTTFPTIFVTVEEIPTNANGKIDRAALAKYYENFKR